MISKGLATQPKDRVKITRVNHGDTHTRLKKTITEDTLVNVSNNNVLTGSTNRRMLDEDFVAVEPKVRAQIVKTSRLKDPRKRNETARKQKIIDNTNKGILENNVINHCMLTDVGIREVIKQGGYAATLMGFDQAQKRRTVLQKMLVAQKKCLGQ